LFRLTKSKKGQLRPFRNLRFPVALLHKIPAVAHSVAQECAKAAKNAGYDKYRNDFAKLIWQLASPKWNFDDATFDRSAASFDNPDHVSIVIHNYRWRQGRAQGESKYDDLERRLPRALSSP
jgi:hypothetical protein